MIQGFDPRTPEPAAEPVADTSERRWLVPVAYQSFPPELLPPGLA
jgi:hypothetical protein